MWQPITIILACYGQISMLLGDISGRPYATCIIHDAMLSSASSLWQISWSRFNAMYGVPWEVTWQLSAVKALTPSIPEYKASKYILFLVFLNQKIRTNNNGPGSWMMGHQVLSNSWKTLFVTLLSGIVDPFDRRKPIMNSSAEDQDWWCPIVVTSTNC